MDHATEAFDSVEHYLIRLGTTASTQYFISVLGLPGRIIQHEVEFEHGHVRFGTDGEAIIANNGANRIL